MSERQLPVLGAISPNQLYRHVASNDDLAISKVKGVGKKLAQRIVLELTGKIKSLAMESNADMSIEQTSHAQMTIDALMSLGFKKWEAETVIAKVNCSQPVE